MNTTDKNPPQPDQKRQAAESPLKKPETDTSHAQTSDVERAASGKEAGLGGATPAQERQAGEAGEPVSTHGEEPSRGTGDPVYAAHPRGIDVINDELADSTIDTDGKGADAKKEGQNIQAIVSQATLVNAVPTPDEGLGGFDSRVGGELPLMALRDGYEVVDHGVVPPVDRPRPIFVTTMVDDGSETHAARGEPYVGHRLRPERLIEIRVAHGAKH